MSREQWHLTFVANDDRPPAAELRVRRLLKAALRAYSLRCVSVGPPPKYEEKPHQDGAGGTGDR